MAKHRKHYTPQEKVAVLRRHLLEHVPVSNPTARDALATNGFVFSD